MYYFPVIFCHTCLVISDRRFKVVKFSRNFRHQAALLVGYEFAKGDVIVTLDADLQDPP